MRSDGEPFRHGIKARHRSPRLSALGKQRSRKPGCWGAASGQGTTALSCSKTRPPRRRETAGPVQSSPKVPRKPGPKRRTQPQPERKSRLYAILFCAPVPEFKALVKGDGGLVVYGPSRAFGRVATLRRGFGVLGFDPRAFRPAPNAPSPAPDPAKLSRSRSPSEQGVRRGGAPRRSLSTSRDLFFTTVAG